MSAATDVMEQVVARLVAAIEAGAGEWTMPWRTLGRAGLPVNAATGKRYSGGNVLALHFAAVDQGYVSSRWATYKQWGTLGAQVRKGERGTRALYWHVKPGERITESDADSRADVELRSASRVAWARAFTVFNAGQVDNDPDAELTPDLTPLERDGRAEVFFRAIPAAVGWGQGNPCYRHDLDAVVMPTFDAFDTAADAYATLSHELAHWTGHATRLARTYGRRFGDDTYAAEELVAELSAAFTCAVVGIDTVARADHAAYLAHWCQMLRAQPAILWTVAAKAQAATDYLAAYSQHPDDLAA